MCPFLKSDSNTQTSEAKITRKHKKAHRSIARTMVIFILISAISPGELEGRPCKDHKDQPRRGQISESGQANIPQGNKSNKFHNQRPAVLRNSSQTFELPERTL